MAGKFSKLNEEQEDALYRKASENPKWTLEQLPNWLQQKYHLNAEPNKSSISRQLKRKRYEAQSAESSAPMNKKTERRTVPRKHNILIAYSLKT